MRKSNAFLNVIYIPISLYKIYVFTFKYNFYHQHFIMPFNWPLCCISLHNSWRPQESIRYINIMGRLPQRILKTQVFWLFNNTHLSLHNSDAQKSKSDISVSQAYCHKEFLIHQFFDRLTIHFLFILFLLWLSLFYKTNSACHTHQIFVYRIPYIG